MSLWKRASDEKARSVAAVGGGLFVCLQLESAVPTHTQTDTLTGTPLFRATDTVSDTKPPVIHPNTDSARACCRGGHRDSFFGAILPVVPRREAGRQLPRWNRGKGSSYLTTASSYPLCLDSTPRTIPNRGLCVVRCFQCLVELDDSLRLCWGHVLSKYGVRNMDSCFSTIDRIFNHNQKVLQAGRVGGGYDRQLRNIMLAEIMPLVEEFDEKLNSDSVYEERLQAAADRFIAAASKLPRATGCFPPCGFQVSGAVYNCVTCLYDSCEYPLDCPMVDLTVGESNSTEMRCDVQFPLPSDIEVVWRFAPEVSTQQVEQFGLVTVGEDRLYSISSARVHHQGTYQCEIFSQQRSVVRTYHHLKGEVGRWRGHCRGATSSNPD
ncbi:hypothetical protein SKAU_G00402660 [Synaphobranchus kaupii]|uniref:Ig-like domain-containing protein n=1 Tax=Synaphobranchus kaupii TaxID=118154 RepID=A0A9Q1E9F1_SYNKA|nr:hypothetical protein SKAU_G00402660 [Synaphobranchus kaupii]